MNTEELEEANNRLWNHIGELEKQLEELKTDILWFESRVRDLENKVSILHMTREVG